MPDGATVQANSVLARYDLTAAPEDRWELPRALDEISGLAVDSAGRVFAHNDERAVVFQLDPATHRVVKRFSIGHPAVRGDFEAVTWVGNRLILTTSDGVLYGAREGGDGEAVPFVMYATGVGRSCEVEGLAYDSGDQTLLLACKLPRAESLRGYLTVFRWSLDRRAPVSVIPLLVPLSRITRLLGEPHFHPSELAWDPATGHYLVATAREPAIAELTSTGEVVRVVRLQHALHRQVEGLAIAPDGALLVSDEAAGKRATLSVYPRVR